MSKEQPMILISQKGAHDTLCGNNAAAELISDKERLGKIITSIGRTVTWYETSALHGKIEPPFARGSDVEAILSEYGVLAAVSGQDAEEIQDTDVVTLFLPPALARTALSAELAAESQFQVSETR